MRIWIDLSDIIEWEGSYTGIQRTQFLISEALLRAKPGNEIKFCAFVRTGQEAFNFTELTDVSLADGRFDFGAVPQSYKDDARDLKGRIKKKVLSKAVQSEVFKLDADIFSAEDVYIALGGYWHLYRFSDSLLKLKQQKGVHVISMVYDLLPAYAGQYFAGGRNQPFIDYFKNVMSAADSLLAISQATASDVKKFQSEYMLRKAPVSVVRLGDSFKEITGDTEDDMSSDGAVLVVCTIEARKNHMILYQAYKLAQSQGVQLPKLQIVGKRGWLAHDIVQLIENDETIDIELLGGVDDQRLEELYQKALFCVYPSVCEGWGLPIAEALSYGKFCIASGQSSMPEVAGDLVDYASPHDSREWMEKIARYANDHEALKSAEARIKNEFKPVSWDSTARQVLEAVKSLSG